jgi:UDP-N-acetylglucosamine:LPS N-acetylglucosamine transferase
VRVLVVTAATGQGHISAARALAESLAAAGAEPVVFDAGEHPLIRRGAALYNFFLRRSPRWMPLFYALVESGRLASTGASPLRAWSASVLRRERPQIVVSVHPVLNQGIAAGIEETGLPLPFAVVLTDLAPPFWRGWTEPSARLTVAPTTEAAQTLLSRGVSPERLEIIGMPVAERFRAPSPPEARRQARERLGLVGDRLTLLLIAGSAGRASGLEVLDALIESREQREKLQVLFAAGTSASLAREARRRAAPFPLHVLGWRDDVDVLLDASDAVFTKPGGLTVAEALGKGAPLLLDAIGGIFPQERGGAAWVERERLGWVVTRATDVPALLENVRPIEWQESRERCRRALPGGSREIARRILALT